MKLDPTSDSSPSAADALFDRYIVSLEGDAPIDFEGLCRAHPAHAERLRILLANHELDRRVHRAGGAPTNLPDDDEDARIAKQIKKELWVGGAQVSRYRDLKKIGAGGMGVVYEAVDTLMRRRVALKMVPEGRRSDDLLPRLRREMLISAKLNHPRVAGAQDTGVDDKGRAFFTMPLIPGHDLLQTYDLAREGREGWTQIKIVGLLRDVCDTMAYVHRRGIIHRDLKPQNIRVGQFHEVHVLDWGLAKDLRVTDTDADGLDSEQEMGPASNSLAGVVTGTPQFMAPEQASRAGDGEVQVGPPADIYAIGAMLYLLIAGHEQYCDDKHERQLDPMTVRDRLRAGPPTPLRKLAPKASRELIAICEKAMKRVPAERYPSMEELSEDLRNFLEGRAVRALGTGAWIDAKKWMQRNRLLTGSLASAVLLLIAGLWTALVLKAESDSKTADVLSLSTARQLADLEREADQLWPATTKQLSAYDEWLAQARVLVNGRARDEGPGKRARPSIDGYEARLRSLRDGVPPRSPRQVEDDRLSFAEWSPWASAQYKEWREATGEYLWRMRMLGEQPWPSRKDVEAELNSEFKAPDWRSMEALQLEGLARALVVPPDADRVYGDEVKGRVLAEQALQASSPPERSKIRETLIWALYRSGEFDRALQEIASEPGANVNRTDDIRWTSLTDVSTAIDHWKSAEGLQEERAKSATLRERIDRLEPIVNLRQTLEFENSDVGWMHDRLQEVVMDLHAFRDRVEGDPGTYSNALRAEHGWDIARRRQEAVDLEAKTLTSLDARSRWAAAIEAIAHSAQYKEAAWPGGHLIPQVGLLPIGEDPGSHLWEFWHVQSGVEPKRTDGQRLVPTAETGVVLVLIPGGTYWMGAQNNDTAKPNFDGNAEPDEFPYQVTLSPYFISKYEMTQRQWDRFAAENPSQYKYGETPNGQQISSLNPVEQVTWDACNRQLFRLGLVLPTESQWEFACRGGSETPVWTGASLETLPGNVNLVDKTAVDAGAPWSIDGGWTKVKDGFIFHAPIASFPPNPFGLHETLGNVYEWCKDWYGNEGEFQAGDGERLTSSRRFRVLRGGCFWLGPTFARSAKRIMQPGDNTDGSIGVRPARLVDP